MSTPSNGSADLHLAQQRGGCLADIVLGDILANVPNSAAKPVSGQGSLLTLGLDNRQPTLISPAGNISGRAHQRLLWRSQRRRPGPRVSTWPTATNVVAGTPDFTESACRPTSLVDPGLLGDIGGNGSIDAGAIVQAWQAFLVHANPPAEHLLSDQRNRSP